MPSMVIKPKMTIKQAVEIIRHIVYDLDLVDFKSELATLFLINFRGRKTACSNKLRLAAGCLIY